jgi:hypothetical protein
MHKIVITSILGILLSFTAMAQDKKVAVFDPAGKVDENTLEIVREEISSIIVNTAGYTVLERQLINKVLEENKFQQGSLVDDAQISEIGKRMGANYVFVTNITLMGDGIYYISCKMIDVLTARIEKQKTGQTTQKASNFSFKNLLTKDKTKQSSNNKSSDDLITVVQRIVKEMFVG